MHWEATQAVGPVGPGWHPDPFDLARLRWWNGSTWAARVLRLEADSHMISWHHRIGEQPGPTAVLAPPVIPRGADVLATLDTLVPDAPPPPAAVAMTAASDGPTRAHPRRSRRGWAMLGAAALIVAAGAGAATAMLSGGQRPTVEDAITYRDDAADFALRYPTAWQIDKRTPGEGVRFIIGSKDALAADRNTLTVVAGTSPGQPLPALHLLADQATQELIAEHPNFRLISATQTRLADAPAFRFEFVDKTDAPPIRILEVQGRTTSGRPLTVVMTVREPRTAPTDEELGRFLASITSS